ncbi:MAG TPA: alpha/beta hydrolase [Steroidobacteraceae bacterium]|nr:alpha/beta hydrolase [Steroidobacteraceae bacterium]
MPFLDAPSGRIEYQRIAGTADGSTGPIVMLHEGLGSIALWRDFPSRLAQATGCEVVVYSRHGYGSSAPLTAPRAVRYMHDEALTELPAILDALRVEQPILFGHSDGGSIALIHAGARLRAVHGVVTLAPHVLVEDISVTSIAAAKTAYETTDLRARLGRYHDDVDGVFRGWNRIWLDPAFRAWNIEEYLPAIDCPILAIQGEQDEYGTMEQIERIARGARSAELLKLARCRHSPHRDQPEQVLTAVARWIQRLPGR